MTIKHLKTKRFVIKVSPPIQVAKTVSTILHYVLPLIPFSQIRKETFEFAILMVKGIEHKKLVTVLETEGVKKEYFTADKITAAEKRLSFIITTNYADIKSFELQYIEIRLYKQV